MPRKIVKGLSLILIPIMIVSGLLIFYSSYLDTQIDNLYNPSIGRTYGLAEKEKGIKLIQTSAKNDDLIIFGSSELKSFVPQNPINMFPNSQLDSNVNIVGMPLVQDLNDCIRVGSNSSELKNKKVVILLSMQWFMGKDVASTGFASHFSELQFYKFMNNRCIGMDEKKYICNRSRELLSEKSSINIPYIYTQYYGKDNILSNIVFGCFKPYYFIREKFLELKDKYQAYKVIINQRDNIVQSPKVIDWDNELIEAEKMGKESCTTNDLYISDGDWNGCISKIYEDLNGAYTHIEMQQSKEWTDYEHLLRICKQCEINPYIVVISANGFYYDYTGVTLEKRVKLYDRIETQLKTFGFEYLDLRDYEYDPYFFRDGMHLGWKGWLYVNKKITEHYCS